MVLDLRSNPGGLLQEAVLAADHFLQKNQLIVYHYGRHSREKRYYATNGNNGNDYPMVVLINRLTASAAEIVSGALQDHDRALILGEPSFGKGLVQTVYPLSERTGLALTTARYYTPSGRLIQREYSNVSLYDYYYHPEHDSTPHTDLHTTDGGRDVYGGGGIAPDLELQEPKQTPTQEALRQHDAFLNFSKHYLSIHKTISQDFQATPDVLEEFKRFLASQNFKISDQDFNENLDFMRNGIRTQLVASIYGENEADRISVQNDFLVQKALEHLPQAKELMENPKKYMASKARH